METSIIVAEIFGIYFIVAGMFLILRGKTIPALLKDFFGHPAFVYLTGIIMIFLASLFLLTNNVWDGTINTIVTVLVWLFLFKGIAYVFFPEALNKMVKARIFGRFSMYGVVLVLAGITLLYLA